VHNRGRLERIIEKCAARPDKWLPQILGDASQLEGAYRFLRNEQVSPDALQAAEAEETKLRAVQARRVVIAHDTTTFVFGGDRKALGRMVGKGRGFLGHFALAIDGAASMPLGVLHEETVVRGDEVKARKRVSPEDETNEALRCNRGGARDARDAPGCRACDGSRGRFVRAARGDAGASAELCGAALAAQATAPKAGRSASWWQARPWSPSAKSRSVRAARS
jgi:hypothetical protein